MTPKTRLKMKQAIREFITHDATDFELLWVYHRIFHERQALTANPPNCEKCKSLDKN